MPMSSKNHTIDAHLQVIPNKYELARVAMLRTRQLISGTGPRIDKRVDPELKPNRRQTLPNSRAPKVALDEILLGSVKFRRIEGSCGTNHEAEDDGIVFTV
jgi:hypothetical protein